MSNLYATITLCFLVATVAVGLSGGDVTLVSMYALFGLFAAGVGMVWENW